MVFIKKNEDFICEKCGFKVLGTGYTNHCPKCLYSKHVDVNPGDREESCGGLMIADDLYYKNGKWIITHRCESCGFTRNDKIREEDDFEKVLELEKKINEKKIKKVFNK